MNTEATEQHCVTILMPCFNASKYLAQALQSMLAQSHQNLIVLLLDDGSTDDSLRIAQDIAQSDKRVQIHCNNKNLGIIKSRNKLLDLCTTDYAAWMDCDDIAKPERITKQLQFMLEHPNYIACTCHYLRQGLGEDKMITIPSHTISREFLLFYNYVLNPGSFFDVVRCKHNKVQFREWISGASDYLFWVELVQFGKIGAVAETLMTYRLHPEQETVAQKQRQLRGVLEIVQYQLAQFGCQTTTEDLARLLGYPAHILGLNYRLSHLFNSAKIIKCILSNLPQHDFVLEQVEALLFGFYRSLARRNGLIGFIWFVRLFKLTGLKRCQHFGLDFLCAALKTDLKRLPVFDARSTR
ncbi:glycosyltransferase family 2 protein [Paraglaciecola sp.]|uniref:glycosyltransferase family 2 protein n=1 Tax=Paraglaciecola sp. TaxID=1920173 RepID=UPI0030F40B07